MFGKKKTVAVKGAEHQCQVTGCGLVCSDEATLKRHMDWAHPAGKTPATQSGTPGPGQMKK
jgi:hypothetical protein